MDLRSMFCVFRLRMLLTLWLACILVMLLFGASPSKAGDISGPAAINKAAPSAWSLGAYPALNGVIVGIYTEGGGSSVNASVPGVPSASLTTTTAAIGATVGYMYTPKGGNVSFSFEEDFCAKNFNGSNAGLSLQGPLCFEQRVMAFAPWQNLLAALPNIPNPFSSISAFSFQPGVTPVGNMIAGIGVGAYERDISTAFAGVQANKIWMANPELVFMNVQPLSNGTALRGWIKLDFNNNAKVFGATPAGFTQTSLGSTGIRAGLGAAF